MPCTGCPGGTATPSRRDRLASGGLDGGRRGAGGAGRNTRRKRRRSCNPSIRAGRSRTRATRPRNTSLVSRTPRPPAESTTQGRNTPRRNNYKNLGTASPSRGPLSPPSPTRRHRLGGAPRLTSSGRDPFSSPAPPSETGSPRHRERENPAHRPRLRRALPPPPCVFNWRVVGPGRDGSTPPAPDFAPACWSKIRWL